ncbi:hypothetical protein DFH08DRAFT_904447 [Mycena albidolilacea]|uniref:F-box domain-containing protein n=1 Tax=Mycena albidolilacea TaxID=1033008 RepID=A0AAD7E8H6_9AGAR|nr:hypothetical protein DFH08DRAFT_904447 [Mycena albidolilacea]
MNALNSFPLDMSVVPGTRHYTLLNSNDELPEDSELAFLHSVISDVDARLACLEEEISTIQEKLMLSVPRLASHLAMLAMPSDADARLACLDETSTIQEKLMLLEKERVSLSSYRARNKAILSPLRRMPPEVLGDIFWRTVPSKSEAQRTLNFFLVESPWTLTQICSRWREISLSIASLWSRIIVDYRTACHYPVSLVEAQIHRSRVQKLEIHFHGSDAADPCPQTQIFQLLLQHSSRWEALHLTLTPEIIPHLTALPAGFPSLKRLYIQWNSQESQTIIDCFRVAPSLVDLCVFNKYRPLAITHPTHQLTHYFLVGPWEEHRRILKLAHNLIEAHIAVKFDDEPWPQPDEPITLPHLRGLHVSRPRCLDYLKAPALEGLGFYVRQDDPPDIRHLESFIGRSACPLRKLCLRGFADVPTTTQILETLPSITELVIFNKSKRAAREKTNALVEALTVSDRLGTVIAPHLSVLLFACGRENDIGHQTYIQMVESRWQAAECALKSAALLIQLGPPLDSATFSSLDTLRQEGLDFWLLQGPGVAKEMNALVHAPSWMR